MPSIVDRPACHYVAESATLKVTDLAEIADRMPEIVKTLAEQGIQPADAPFLRYRVIQPDLLVTVEACVPVRHDAEVAQPMFVSELPAGKYVADTYVGPPDGVASATEELLVWGNAHGVNWDNEETSDGVAWAGRLEVMRTNPLEVSDPSEWVTDLLIKVA